MHRNTIAVLAGAQLAAAGLYPGITADNHTCLLGTFGRILLSICPV